MWKDDEQSHETPTINDQLGSQQREELQGLLHQFSDTIQSNPGRTDCTEHRIDVGENRPIRLPPYRLPHAYKEQVKQELKEMEATGIIEPSLSEWPAPIVLVKKKDGTLRFCIDYRRLNSVARYDPYPMPRVDDMIDKLGKVTYITTLDLTRGYWQVPME